MHSKSAELIHRQADALRVCSFGVPFLDDALNGMRPRDLTIIGASTGLGKTEIGTSIAMNNALAGKRVVFFALEAETFEIERRIKYQLLATKFFERRSNFPGHIRLNFTDWLHDKYGDDLISLEQEVAEEIPMILENLMIYSPESTQFSKRDFSLVYEEVSKECNLVILDHVHYLSPEDREGEYDHLKKLIWKIKDLINKHEVPLIAISHMRKEEKRDDSLVPAITEFHGSSEISKQAHHVISMAPCYWIPSATGEEKIEMDIGSTLCRVLKTRTGHSGCQRYLALLKFNVETKTYENNYVPFRTNKWGSQLNRIKLREFEGWMARAKEAKV